MNFNELGLSEPLLRALEAKGYDQPTPIQARAIPALLDGRDMLAAAQTGTGKTAAFVLPILQTLSESEYCGVTPRALILTPTRELAAQIETNIQEYGSELPLRSAVIFGGVSAVPQTKLLRKGVDLLVATPGRLLDLVQQRVLSLKDVETFVLDEADRMLDMGFIHDIRRVLKLLPTRRQNLLFSATYSPDIEKLAHKLLHDPVQINVAPKNAAADTVQQASILVDKGQKRAMLSWLIQSHDWQQVLVFTRTKHGANRLTKQLEIDGIRAAAIHGNKSQSARTKALAEFKAGQLRVLVATDIAARGIDIDLLPHVVNYELPNVPEDYVHRIGRTGRAGAVGEAVALVDGEERKLLKAIERLIGRSIEPMDVSAFVPPPHQPQPAADAPRNNPRHNHPQKRSQAGAGDKPNPQRRRRRKPRVRREG